MAYDSLRDLDFVDSLRDLDFVDWVPNSDGIARFAERTRLRCALRSYRELQENNPEIFS